MIILIQNYYMAIYQQIKCIQILTKYFESLIDVKSH